MANLVAFLVLMGIDRRTIRREDSLPETLRPEGHLREISRGNVPAMQLIGPRAIAKHQASCGSLCSNLQPTGLRNVIALFPRSLCIKTWFWQDISLLLLCCPSAYHIFASHIPPFWKGTNKLSLH